MRILQISSARTFGGGERHVVDLCRGLQSRGHDVFAALRPTSEWKDRLSFLPAGHLIEVSIRNSIGVFSAIRMADFIRENDIQIVHAHVARDYIPASIACMAARSVRFVLTRHVMFPLKPFNRFALKNLSAAIGVSSAVGTELSRLFAPSKIAVIPNGIDIDNYSSTEPAVARTEFRELHKIPEDVPVVGTLGELKELKGQREFVIAAAEVIRAVPDCRFVIVGVDNTVDKRFRRELKRLAGVSGLGEKILWLDWLDDTAGFYSAIDVFVSPSRSESFGLAILEAMAHGKAIVATETDGAKELIADCGVMVPVNEPVTLANEVSRLLDDRDEMVRIGLHAKQIASIEYSLDRMIDETEALYGRIIGGDPV